MKSFVSFVFCLIVFTTPVLSQQTDYVVIVVIDGARYTETFGDATHQYIPRIWNTLRSQGTIYMGYYNNGTTVTNPGHASIVSGKWQYLTNDGNERPHTPTLFEYYRKEDGAPANANYVVLGKDKLDIMAYSDYATYGAAYGASVCQSPLSSSDHAAADSVKSILQRYRPRLLAVNLPGVDYAGHAGNWNNYLTALRAADSLTYVIWDAIQDDPVMGGKTTMFVTNDHGRHTTDFTSHGDNCEGCRHIMLLVMGPDTPAGAVDASTRQQIDIVPTIGALMGFATPLAEGTIITSAISESGNPETKLYVSVAGSDVTGDGTPGNPFRTIAKGVTTSLSGDTVQVLPGTYVEAVDVNKSLVLLGSGSATTTIEAPADFATNSAYDHALTNFTTERAIVHVGSGSPITAKISGFTIDGKSLGPNISQGVAYSALLAEQCSVTVTENVIKNMLAASGPIRDPDGLGRNGRGIHVRGSGAVATIDGNTLQEINRIHIMINATDDTSRHPAVFPHAVVSNNTITGKGLYGGGQKGIWYNTGAWGEISGNSIADMDYPDPVIEPDRATGIVSRFGYLDPAHRRIIRNNTLTVGTSVNSKGMYIQGTRDSVVDNALTGFRWGMEIHDEHLVTVQRNSITGGVIGMLVTTEHAPGTADSILIGGSPANRNTITGQNIAAGGFAISLSFRDPFDPVTFQSPIPVDARYNDFGVYTESEIRTRIWDRADTTLIHGLKADTVLFYPFYMPPPASAVANLRAFFQGPFAADTMSIALNTGGMIPKVNPYGGAPWNYAGGDSVDAIPAAVVDWVLVELRTDTAASTTVSRQAAFIKTDGSIVDLDGASAVSFDGVSAGSYYVVVRHRNHLAVMSHDPVALDDASPVYDFATGPGQYYGSDAAPLGGGKYGLWAGDADASGDVAALDRTATWNDRNKAAYQLPDVDLSGDVAAQDRTITWNNRNKTSRVP